MARTVVANQLTSQTRSLASTTIKLDNGPLRRLLSKLEVTSISILRRHLKVPRVASTAFWAAALLSCCPGWFAKFLSLSRCYPSPSLLLKQSAFKPGILGTLHGFHQTLIRDPKIIQGAPHRLDALRHVDKVFGRGIVGGLTFFPKRKRRTIAEEAERLEEKLIGALLTRSTGEDALTGSRDADADLASDVAEAKCRGRRATQSGREHVGGRARWCTQHGRQRYSSE
jgi:hypothetical protein